MVRRTDLPAPFLWEQHCCLPLSVEAPVAADLGRYARAGGSYVSVNVGYAPHSTQDVLSLLECFHAQIRADPRLMLADSTADVARAVEDGRIAVAFDLEDSNPLGGDLGNVRRFCALGVRTMLPTYNHANAAGSGCLDPVDGGLTTYGHDLVAEMNAVGMVIDGSHCGSRTALQLCEVSTAPVIYSHSCMRSVWEHPRNITDEQARVCADTGGVIGINGVGFFLGANTATLKAMVDHIDYAVSLVGVQHVGLGSDFSFDFADFNDELAKHPDCFDESYTRWGPISWVPPETLPGIGAALAGRGYSTADIAAVLGGNFLRVAEQVWQAPQRHAGATRLSP